MTEEATTTTAAPVAEEENIEGRCRAGRKTDNPCWREATTTTHDSFACCDEHARLCELAEEVDAWHCALDMVEEWIRGPVSEDYYGELERLALKMQDEIRLEYAHASAKAYAARLVVDQGPPKDGESRLTLEQSEKLARLIIHADSFVDARTALEDAPKEVLGSHDRWIMVNALAAAAQTAGEAVSSYKQEIGLRPE
jgi:hypothetical protein